MATNQHDGHCCSKDCNQPCNQCTFLPATFTVAVRDLSSESVKETFGVAKYRLLCKAILGLMALFCKVKLVSYTVEENHPSTRRTIIITDQIVRKFMHNNATDDIDSQLYPDLPRPGPSNPGSSPELSKAPAIYRPSNVCPKPIFSVSFAKKVAEPPPNRSKVRDRHKKQANPAPSVNTHNINHAANLNNPSSNPPTRSGPEHFPPTPKTAELPSAELRGAELPTAQLPSAELPASQIPSAELPTATALSVYEHISFLPPNPDFAEDLLNMMMDPGKHTLLIICSKKAN